MHVTVWNFKEIFYDWGGFNEQLFYAINAVHGAAYDKFMMLGTMLGKYKLFPLYLLLIVVVAYYDLSHNKTSLSPDYAQYRECWLKTIAVLVLAFLFDLLWVHFLKDYLNFPRPFIALPEYTVIKLWDETPYGSFPSGHCCFAMLMTAGLWPILGKTGKTLAIVYVAWVGLSRIVLGVHFPADVLGSLILSFVAVYLVRQVVYRVWPRNVAG